MIDLSPHHLETVKRILDEHVPGCEVKAFGSRATWTATDYSDLDLLVLGQSEVAGATLSRLNEAFEESDLPMRVDVVDWHGTSPAFRKLIEPSCVRLPMAAGADWSQTAFGDCALLVGDKVDPASCGDMPYIGLEHIGQGTLSLLGNGTAADVESTKTVFRAGDILFGKLRPYFRKVVRPDFDGICSTDIWAVRPRAGVDAAFLFYLMASEAFVDFASQGSEGTRMPRAKWDHVVRHTVHLPSLAEQRAIAHVLGTLDEKTELCRRMATTMEDLVGTLFTSWFVNSDVGKIPNGWSVKLLGELLELAYGKSLRSSERQGGSIPVYGSNGQVGWHDRKLVDGPGIVVGRKGNPGVVTWSQRDFFPIDTTFYVIPKANVSLYFLFHALKNQGLQSMAADSAVPGLNRNIAYMSRQLVPDTEAMRAFDRHAASALLRRDQLNAESMTLADLRDWLLPKLVSGQIRVADAENLAEVAT